MESVRCHRKRRPKLSIWWMLASFALLQFGISAAIEARLVSVRDPEYAFREARWRERLAEHPHQKRIVFLGSSRVACGIDAERITRRLNGDGVAFNFGIPRAGPFSQRTYLERLHETGLLPDVVVIEIMPPMLCGKDVPYEDHGLDGEKFALSELTDVSLVKNVRGAYRKWLFHRSLPVRTHGEELRHYWGLDTLTPATGIDRENGDLDPYGWRASGLPPERLAEVTALAHRQYDEHYRAFAIHPVQARRLHEFAARCRELGVDCKLLLMPEGSEFRRLMPADGEAQLQALLSEIRSRHGIAVIDARGWMKDDAFLDMHHLDGQAAMVFSERLAGAIRKSEPPSVASER